MEHLKGPFGLNAALSSDMQNIRYINADLGEGKRYARIASVHYCNELTLEENLATAELLRSAPELRDDNQRLREQLASVESVLYLALLHQDFSSLGPLLADVRKSLL